MAEIRVASPVPSGYDVSHFAGDGSRIYHCPHEGCKDVVFYTIQECKIHDRDWHEGPYECTCGEVFASRPALHRHIRASYHREREPEIFACAEECCPQFRFEYATHANLTTHTSGAVHQAAEKRSCYLRNILEEVEGHIRKRTLAFQNSQCDVPGCPDEGRVYVTSSAFLKHIDLPSHKNYDNKFAKALATSAIPEFQSRQKVKWQFECSKPGCPEYKRRFRTNVSFWEHCETEAHASAETDTNLDLEMAEAPARTPSPALEGHGLPTPPNSSMRVYEEAPSKAVIDLTHEEDSDHV
ncbi:hypothetical protein LIA77_05814 [Sarocladium implicatum]|nr:hypothetical protein LIA77_05814 [Sarocladium implicatum]